MSEDTSADGVIAGTAECTHPRLEKTSAQFHDICTWPKKLHQLCH